MILRYKGVAIVKSRKGILIVSKKGTVFSLPGGGANVGESRKKAVLRELREETGLIGFLPRYFCSYVGRNWKNRKNSNIKNMAQVFIVWTIGTPKPKNEIKYVHWYKQGDKLKLSKSTESVLKKYYRYNN